MAVAQQNLQLTLNAMGTLRTVDEKLGNLAGSLSPLLKRMAMAPTLPLSSPAAQTLSEAGLMKAGGALPVYSTMRYTPDASGAWGYGGPSRDSISFAVDADILLWGTYAFAGKSGNEYDIQCELHDGNGSGDNEWERPALATGRLKHTGNGKADARPVYFTQAVVLKAGKKYSLVAKTWASNNGFKGKSGQSNTTERGVKFSWESSSGSSNGTDTGSGQLPGAIFSVVGEPLVPPAYAGFPGYTSEMGATLVKAPSDVQVPTLKGVKREDEALDTQNTSPAPEGLPAPPSRSKDEATADSGLSEQVVTAQPYSVLNDMLHGVQLTSGVDLVLASCGHAVAAAPAGATKVHTFPSAFANSHVADAKPKSGDASGGAAAGAPAPPSLQRLLSETTRDTAEELAFVSGAAEGSSAPESKQGESKAASSALSLPAGWTLGGLAFVGDWLVARRAHTSGEALELAVYDVAIAAGSQLLGCFSVTGTQPAGEGAVSGLCFNGTELLLPVSLNATTLQLTVVDAAALLQAVHTSASSVEASGKAVVKGCTLQLLECRFVQSAAVLNELALFSSVSGKCVVQPSAESAGTPTTGFAVCKAILSQESDDSSVASKSIVLQGAARCTAALGADAGLAAVAFDARNNVILTVKADAEASPVSIGVHRNAAVLPTANTLAEAAVLQRVQPVSGNSTGAGLANMFLQRIADRASVFAPPAADVGPSPAVSSASAALAKSCILFSPLALCVTKGCLGQLAQLLEGFATGGEAAPIMHAMRLMYAHLMQVVAGSGIERSVRIKQLTQEASAQKLLPWASATRKVLHRLSSATGSRGMDAVASFASKVLNLASDVFEVTPQEKCAAVAAAVGTLLREGTATEAGRAALKVLIKAAKAVEDTTALVSFCVGGSLLPPQADPTAVQWTAAGIQTSWSPSKAARGSEAAESVLQQLLQLVAQQAVAVSGGEAEPDNSALTLLLGLVRCTVGQAREMVAAAADTSGDAGTRMQKLGYSCVGGVLVPLCEATAELCGTVLTAGGGLGKGTWKALQEYITPLAGAAVAVLTVMGATAPDAAAAMTGLTEAVVALHAGLQAVSSSIPPSSRTRTTQVDVVRTAEEVAESKHPYDNNTSEYKKLHFPGATCIKISFDSKSHTEATYDYVKFLKSQSESSLQYGTTYSGRTFPGPSNPLVIPDSTVQVFFKTDGSGTEWGWKFTATAEFPSKEEKQTDIALVQLAAEMNNAVGWLIQSLTGGTAGAVKEEVKAALSNPLLCGGLQEDAASRPASAGGSAAVDIDTFLLAFAENSSDLGIPELLKFMKKKTPGDRGSFEAVNSAVRYVIASALRHAHLGGEAMRLADALKRKAAGDKTASAKPSTPLSKVWRTAQAVRQWVTTAAVGRVPPAQLRAVAAELLQEQEQGGSAVESKHASAVREDSNDPEAAEAAIEELLCGPGRDELLVRAAADGVRQRAQLLLETRVCTPSNASNRWAQLGTNMRSLSARSLGSPGGDAADSLGDGDTGFAELVTKATAAAELRTMLSFQKAIAAATVSKRAAAASGAAGKPQSSQSAISALVNKFVMQLPADDDAAPETSAADPLTSSVRAAMADRTAAALSRSKGFKLASELLAGMQNPKAAEGLMLWLLRGLRRRPKQSDEQEGADMLQFSAHTVHFLSGLEGAGPSAQRAVRAAAQALLVQAVALISQASSPTSTVQVALLLLAQDYNVGDIGLLQEAHVLSVLRKLLSPRSAAALAIEHAGAQESKSSEPSGTALDDKPLELAADASANQSLPAPRTMADGIMRVLLARLVGLQGQQSPLAVASADLTSGRTTSAMQRSLVHVARDALLSSADDRQLRLLLDAADLRGDGSGSSDLELLATAPEPIMSSPGAVTYLGGNTAVPVFMDGAPRVAPGAVMSDTFTMSMWVYAPTVPLAAMTPEDALTKAKEATVDQSLPSALGSVGWQADAKLGRCTVQPSRPRVVTDFQGSGAIRMNVGLHHGTLQWTVRYTEQSASAATMSAGVSHQTVLGRSVSAANSTMYVVRGCDSMRFKPRERMDAVGDDCKFKSGTPVTFTLTIPESGKAGKLFMQVGTQKKLVFEELEAPLFPVVHLNNPGTSASVEIIDFRIAPGSSQVGTDVTAAAAVPRDELLQDAFGTHAGETAGPSAAAAAAMDEWSLDQVGWDTESARGSWTADGLSKVSGKQSSGIKLNKGISKGTLEWSVKLTGNTRGDERGLLGVVGPRWGAASYDDAKNRAYLVRAYTGGVYTGGSFYERKAEMKFHPDEEVSFKLECGDGTMSPRLFYTNPRGTWELTSKKPMRLTEEYFPAAGVYNAGAGFELTSLQYTPHVAERRGPAAPGVAAVLAAGGSWASATAQRKIVIKSAATASGEKRACVRFSHGAASGVMKFAFKVSDLSAGNESLLLGVSPAAIGSHNYDMAACNSVIIRAYNGAVYVGGKQERLPGDAAAMKFADDEIVSFEADFGTKSLKYTNPRGTFEILPPGKLPAGPLYPVMHTYGNGGTATLTLFESEEFPAGSGAAAEAAEDIKALVNTNGPVLPPVVVSPTDTLLENPTALQCKWQTPAGLEEGDLNSLTQTADAPDDGLTATVEQRLGMAGTSVAEFVLSCKAGTDPSVAVGVCVDGKNYLLRLSDGAVLAGSQGGPAVEVTKVAEVVTALEAGAVAVGEEEPEVEPVRTGSDLKVGDTVRVKASVSSPRYGWGSVKHTSRGKIKSISGDKASVDFPEQSGWSSDIAELETVPEGTEAAAGSAASSEPAGFKEGVRVRFKASVSSPKYGWSGVKHSSVGTIKDIQGDGDLSIDFPEQSSWTGHPDDMEVVAEGGAASDKAVAATTKSKSVATARRVRVGLEVVRADSGELRGRLAYKAEGVSLGVLHDNIPLSGSTLANFAVVFFDKTPVEGSTVRIAYAVQGQPLASNAVRGGAQELGAAGADKEAPRTSVGGLLWSKGYAASLLTESERVKPLQRLAMRMANTRQLIYEASFLEEQQVSDDQDTTVVADATFRMVSFKALPPDTWSQVTLTQDLLAARMFVNGELVAARPLPRAMWTPPVGSMVKVLPPKDFASAHPYENNTNEKHHVAFPGAIGIKIVFASNSKTEESYDYVRFLKGEGSSTQDFWGDEKYTGSKWPGVGSVAALIIPASEFTYSWVTDGSGTEHGWDFTATPMYPDVSNLGKPVPALHATLSSCSGGAASVDMDKLSWKVSSGFPTYTAESMRVETGVWYYEIELLAGSGTHYEQVGWIDDAYTGNSSGGEGVGDCAHSWAYDGQRKKKWHAGGTSWGKAWKEGDTVCFIADMDAGELRFGLNGSFDAPMGSAFTNIKPTGGALRPAACGNSGAHLRMAFGAGLGDLKYPVPAGAKPIGRAVADSLQVKADAERARRAASEKMSQGVQLRIAKLRLAGASGAAASGAGDAAPLPRGGLPPPLALLPSTSVVTEVTTQTLTDVVLNDAPLVFGTPLPVNSDAVSSRRLIAAATRRSGKNSGLLEDGSPLSSGSKDQVVTAAGVFVAGVQISPFRSVSKSTVQLLASDDHILSPILNVRIQAQEGERFLTQSSDAVSTALSLVTEASKSAFGQAEVSDASVVGALLQLITGSNLASALEAVAILRNLLPGTSPDTAIDGLRRAVSQGMDGAATPRGSGSDSATSLPLAVSGGAQEATSEGVATCATVISALLKYVGQALFLGSEPDAITPTSLKAGVCAAMRRHGQFSSAVASRLVFLVRALMAPDAETVHGQAWKKGTLVAITGALSNVPGDIAAADWPVDYASVGGALAVLGGTIRAVQPGAVVTSSGAGGSSGGVESLVTFQVPVSAEADVMEAAGQSLASFTGIFSAVSAVDGAVQQFAPTDQLVPIISPLPLACIKSITVTDEGTSSPVAMSLFACLLRLLKARSAAPRVPQWVRAAVPSKAAGIAKLDSTADRIEVSAITFGLLRLRALRAVDALLGSALPEVAALATDPSSGLAQLSSALMHSAGTSLLEQGSPASTGAAIGLFEQVGALSDAALEQALAYSLACVLDAPGRAHPDGSSEDDTPALPSGEVAVASGNVAAQMPAVPDIDYFTRVSDIALTQAPAQEMEGSMNAVAHPGMDISFDNAKSKPSAIDSESQHPLQGWVGPRQSLHTYALLCGLESRLAQSATMNAMGSMQNSTGSDAASAAAHLLDFLLSSYSRLVQVALNEGGSGDAHVRPAAESSSLVARLRTLLESDGERRFALSACARAVVTLLEACGCNVPRTAGGAAADSEAESVVQHLPPAVRVSSLLWLVSSMASIASSEPVGRTNSLTGVLLTPRILRAVRALFASSMAGAPLLAAAGSSKEDKEGAAYYAGLAGAARNTTQALMSLTGKKATAAQGLSAAELPMFLTGSVLLNNTSEMQSILSLCTDTLSTATATNALDKQQSQASQGLAEIAVSVTNALKHVAPFVSIAAFAVKVAALRKRHRSGKTPSTSRRNSAQPSQLPPLAPAAAASATSKVPLFFAKSTLAPELDLVEQGCAVVMRRAMPVVESEAGAASGNKYVGPLSIQSHASEWNIGALAVVDEPLSLDESVDFVPAVRLHCMQMAAAGSISVGLVVADPLGGVRPAIVWAGGRIHLFDIQSRGTEAFVPVASVVAPATLKEGDLVGITLDAPRRRVIFSVNGTPLAPVISGDASDDGIALYKDAAVMYGIPGERHLVSELRAAAWLTSMDDALYVRATETALPPAPGPAPLVLQRSVSKAGSASYSESVAGEASRLVGQGEELSTFLSGASSAGKGTVASALSKLAWFDELARVSAVLKELQAQQAPHALLMGLFASHFSASHTRIIESKHPVRDGPGILQRTVVVPGASAVRVLLDKRSSVAAGESLTVGTPAVVMAAATAAAPSAGAEVFVVGDPKSTSAEHIPEAYIHDGNLDELASSDEMFRRSSAAVSSSAGAAPKASLAAGFPALSPGDTVVRNAEVWSWGDQDGGDGNEGTVQDTSEGEGWFRVRWGNGSSNVYPYPDRAGKYHLRKKEKSASKAPVVVSPDTQALAADGGMLVSGNAVSISAVFAHASEEESKAAAPDASLKEAAAPGPDLLLPTAPGAIAAVPSSCSVELRWPRFRPVADPVGIDSPQVVFVVQVSAGDGEPAEVGRTTGGHATVYNLNASSRFKFTVGAAWASSSDELSSAPAPAAFHDVEADTALLAMTNKLTGPNAPSSAVQIVSESTTVVSNGVGDSCGVACVGAAVRGGVTEWMYMVLEMPVNRRVALGAYAVPTTERPADFCTGQGMYVISGTGDVFKNGAKQPASHSDGLSEGDVVMVRYDAEARSLSFEVNSEPLGVNITDVAPGTWLAPCVSLGHGPGVQVALLSVSHTSTPTLDFADASIVSVRPDVTNTLAPVLPAAAAAAPAAAVADSSGASGPVVASTSSASDWGLRMAVVPQLDSRMLDQALSGSFLASLPKRLAKMRADDAAEGTAVAGVGGAAAGAGPSEALPMAVPAAPALLKRSSSVVDEVAAVGAPAVTSVTDALAHLQDVYTAFIHDVTSGWSPAADEELVTLVDSCTGDSTSYTSLASVLACEWSTLHAAAVSNASDDEGKLMRRYPHLSAFPVADRQKRFAARFKLLSTFNALLGRTLEWVDFARISIPGSLASALPHASHWVFRVFKDALLTPALDRSKGSGSKFTLVLSRPRHYRFMQSGKVDTEGRHTLFGQAWQVMRDMPTATLRRHGKLFTANFAGERSHDDGGPYREAFAEFCQALQSDSLPLLVRVPNHSARNNTGSNRDCWMLSADATSSVALSQLHFVGKLMGMALRNNEYLSLRLAPLVWRLISGRSAVESDIRDLDAVTHKTLMRIGQDEELTEAAFDSELSGETWVTTLATGRQVEVVPGGAARPLTWATRREYAAAALSVHMDQMRAQIGALRAGLATIVPVNVLSLFSGRQLEELVCGLTGRVDVDLLARMTDYSGYDAGDKQVEWFYDVLREAEPHEVAAVLQFISGRPTIGRNAATFGRRFKIDKIGGGDSRWPQSHSCYNTLDLPQYTTKELLRTRILTASALCKSIDADDTSTGLANAALEAGWD